MINRIGFPDETPCPDCGRPIEGEQDPIGIVYQCTSLDCGSSYTGEDLFPENYPPRSLPVRPAPAVPDDVAEPWRMMLRQAEDDLRKAHATIEAQAAELAQQKYLLGRDQASRQYHIKKRRELEDDNRRLTAELERLQPEGLDWTTCGIVEIAARNPSVMEYMRHWEGRAEKAEAALETQAAELARLRADRDQGAKDYCDLMGHRDALHVRLKTLEAALRPFVAYVHDDLRKGKATYELVAVDRAGGGLIGAEDLRRARAASPSASGEG